ncbi:MAG: hypothetical protein ACKN9F_07195, partial [Methylomonas sp.]
MTSKLTKQQRISIVKERFDTIDWQLAMTMEQTDDFYIGLPDRLENENAITWLRRLGRDYRRRLTDISEIVRWAAADNRFNDAILYTQDERIRLTIRQIDQGVFVKVDVLVTMQWEMWACACIYDGVFAQFRVRSNNAYICFD